MATENPSPYRYGNKRDIELVDVLRFAERATRLGIRTMLPATVQSYDAATQKADVKLDNLVVRAAPEGERTEKQIVVPSCPVRWPRTATGYLTFPLAAEDTGYVIVSDRSLEKYLDATTSKATGIDPVLSHTHNIIDGVFEPGLHPDNAGAAISPATDLTATVLHGNSLISIGRTAADFVYKATTANTAIQTAVTTLTAVPAASDLATVITLANANKAAILAIGNALLNNTSTKVRVE